MSFTFKNIFNQFTPSPGGWRGAAIGVIIATLLIGLVSTIDLLSKGVSYTDASLYFFIGSLIIALIGAVIVFVLLMLSTLPNLYKVAIACFAFISYYFFIPPQSSLGITIVALWIILSCSLFGGSLYSLIYEPTKSDLSLFLRIFCLILGFAGLSFFIYWLVLPNNIYHPITQDQGKLKANQINLPNPAFSGPYQFAALTYGNGTDQYRPKYGKEAAFITPTIDGRPFLNGWSGFEGWLRTRYWGFDASKLPLNGRVHYPLGKGPFPLVLIIHGNHEMSVSSDKGYSYLTELLASHGFITVSVDENFLNDAWLNVFTELYEPEARGWLLLEHLRLWREWNSNSDHPFYHKVDMERIGLIGHSRGGEAIAIAKLFNPLNRYPKDGNIKFDYNFNIRALAAIAPIDGRYTPNGKKVYLKDVDYLVLQGSNDGDIRSFEGIAQYHRIHFTNESYHFKTALYILGANHSQFNTTWGIKDSPHPSGALFNLGIIMPAYEQQRIAEIYIAAFLKTSLNGDKDYLPLFRNPRTGDQWLPKTCYFNQFADSTFQYIDKEIDSLDLTAISLKGGSSIGENLNLWSQSEITLQNGTNVGVGTFLGWNTSESNNPAYIITLPENALRITPENVLVLNVAAANLEEFISENALPQNIDFNIALTDHQNITSELPLSNYGPLYPPLKPVIMKAAFLDPYYISEYVFQSFELPLSDFVLKNSAFNPSTLKSIRLNFDKTPQGLIILDNLALSR